MYIIWIGANVYDHQPLSFVEACRIARRLASENPMVAVIFTIPETGIEVQFRFRPLGV